MKHFTIYLYILILTGTALSIRPLSGAAFSLTDSDPDSPDFRRRFLASHGVNEAIEPKLTVRDRPLQEAIRAAIAMLGPDKPVDELVRAALQKGK